MILKITFLIEEYFLQILRLEELLLYVPRNLLEIFIIIKTIVS